MVRASVRRLPPIPKVGLLIESSRAAGRALLQGIADYAHHRGPWSFFWEPGGLEKAWPKLRGLDLNGIILRDVDRLDETLAFGIPAVVVSHGKTERASALNVVTDSEAIGCMAAEHLLACGFRNFAYCGAIPTAPGKVAPWSRLRQDAFARRLREAGCGCDCYTPRSGSRPVLQQERRALAKWLLTLPRPVGIMACNDDRGVQVIEACKLAGLAVPDAVGVIGADNDEVVCGLSDPAMSSVAIDFKRAGYEAAAALDQLMRGDRPPARKIMVAATHIVARRSTDVVAVQDPHLVRALRFIRDHSREACAVAEVALAAGLSRRVLERRFRRELGRSILDEIRRVRTDQIARMLIETSLPVRQIAEMLGFEDVQHFARYFRTGRQVTPLEFRRAHGLETLSAG